MGTAQGFGAGLTILALAWGTLLQADPRPEPEFNLTSTIVRTLGYRADYPVDSLGQSGCERELRRIRDAKVVSLDGASISIGSAATLTYVSDWVKGAGAGSIESHLERLSMRFRQLGYVDFNYLREDMARVASALESRAQLLGTAEARQLSDSYKRLQSLVDLAKVQSDAEIHAALTRSNSYKIPEGLFQTMDQIRADSARLSRMVLEADAATLASAKSSVAVSANVANVPKVGGGARLAKIGGNLGLALLTAISVIVSSVLPEKGAADHAAEGAVLADEWKKHPDASDAYVFGADVREVCKRAVRDPKGFGKVVGQKMGAIEWWDKLRQYQENDERLAQHLEDQTLAKMQNGNTTKHLHDPGTLPSYDENDRASGGPAI